MTRRSQHPPTTCPPTTMLLCPVLLALMVTVACGASHTEHPSSAIQAYVDAVRARDTGTVYAMLDDGQRMGMDEEAFEGWFDGNYAMVLEQAEVLSRYADQDDVIVHAEVPLDMGYLAGLSFADDAAWRLNNQHLTRSAQQTPREALNAFSDALEQGDFETILGLLSSERRNAYIHEMEVLRDRLSRTDGGGIVTKGEKAVLPLPNGDRILFVRENGVWKIQDFQQVDY